MCCSIVGITPDSEWYGISLEVYEGALVPKSAPTSPPEESYSDASKDGGTPATAGLTRPYDANKVREMKY
jgi:hypothetical protein